MGALDFLMDFPVDEDVEAAFSKIPNELNELGYDPWGFNPDTAKVCYSIARLFYRYFRPTIEGIENIPDGRVLIVPNHSGQLPFDGLVVAVACLLEANPPRVVRAMAERWFPTLPWVNKLFSRSGVVVGAPINCRNLLEADNAILVFPEGARGCGKTIWDRYQLVQFGRGFMRLALQTNAPVVPVGIVGAEESIISVANLESVAKMAGVPYMPVPALLPILGPLAYLPLPTKFSVHVGKPMYFEGPFDDEDEIIEAKVVQVKNAVQELINDGLEKRESIF